jgi:hypothetical protein
MIFIKNMLNKTMVKHISKKSTVATIKIRQQFMVPEKKQALIHSGKYQQAVHNADLQEGKRRFLFASVSKGSIPIVV